jgi:hypothetical protein
VKIKSAHFNWHKKVNVSDHAEPFFVTHQISSDEFINQSVLSYRINFALSLVRLSSLRAVCFRVIKAQIKVIAQRHATIMVVANQHQVTPESQAPTQHSQEADDDLHAMHPAFTQNTT